MFVFVRKDGAYPSGAPETLQGSAKLLRSGNSQILDYSEKLLNMKRISLFWGSVSDGETVFLNTDAA